MARRWLPIVLLLTWFGACRADDAVRLSGESKGAGRRLEEADQLAADKKWAEAGAAYQKIIEEAGDDLVPLGPEPFRRWVAARRLCHLRLAALPADALRRYRVRVEEQARRWLDQGRAAHDERLLQRVVDEAFASTSAGPALDLLGDLAFEHGRFDLAEAWWRLLAVPAGEVHQEAVRAGDVLVFPDPPADLAARARAKQLLAQLFRGEREGFAERLAAYRALHGTTSGRFAGHQGKYADILQRLADEPGALAPPPAAESWTTFAANPARNPVVAQPLPPSLWRDGWQWCFDLQTHTRIAAEDPSGLPQLRAGPGGAFGHLARSLAFHTLIVGDWALVADARQVTAYNLRDGTAQVWSDIQRLHPGLALPTRLPAPPDVRFTLSASGDRIFARMGAPAIVPGKVGPSFLLGLDAEPGRDGNHLRFAVTPRGSAKRPDRDQTAVAFEGTPVVRGQRLYLALTRADNGRSITVVHGYETGPSNAESLLWRQDICEVDDSTDTSPRVRNDLLTLAGPEVVSCSHGCVIVALDALTGRRAWAVRCPRRRTERDDGPSPRDLAPCVYAEGRLYAAPADGDRILCLDPATGRTLWEREHLDVIQFLGVTQGRLIFTWSSPPSLTTVAERGIRAVDAATGADVPGWLQPAEGDLPPFGQGLVAGGQVFWPTADGVRVLGARDGQVAADLDPVQLRRFVPGNLAYGNGYLLVADAERLYVYGPQAGQLGLRREEAARAQDRSDEAVARFRLAIAEADAGLSETAQKDFRRAERLAGPEARWRGMPLRDLARRRRHEVLLNLAEQAATQNVNETAALLTRAADAEFDVPDRLGALGRLAELWARAGQPARAVEAWQAVLHEERLRHGRYPGAGGVPRQAGLYAAARINELIRSHGDSVYEATERQARALLGDARGTQRVPILEWLVREYPNAAVTPPALLELATLHEQAGRSGAAAHAYRRFLQRYPDRADRPRTLAGLARAYEQQHCWEAARATWERLVREQGDRIAPALDPRQAVRQLVVQELNKPAYRTTEPARPDLPLPLLRSWHARLGTIPERVLLPREPLAEDARPFLFLVRDKSLVCCDSQTGRPPWDRGLTDTPYWVGRHADLVIVAAGDTIQGLRLADGAIVWQLQVPGPDYLMRISGLPEAEDGGPDRLDAFRLSASRLFFLQGRRRLFALDADSGRVLWIQWAPGGPVRPLAPAGRFYPFYHAGEERLIVQTSGGKLWVLDAATGQRIQEMATCRTPWPQPPQVLDPGRVSLVTDARHVLLFNPSAARPLWVYEVEHAASLTGEAPEVLGDGNVLLLLIRRNYGVEIDCLDARTGRSRWEALVGREPFAARSATVDEHAVYWAVRGVLHARAMADGKPLWEAPLTGAVGPWRTTRTRRHLVAWPDGARSTGEYPIAVFDPKDGQLIERLNFRVGPVSPASSGGDTGAGLAVQLFGHGAAVVVRDEAWGLTAAR
jgi:outer membrane protein assembly factor BamB/tetratricopeptide (TPR) repeat protein